MSGRDGDEADRFARALDTGRPAAADDPALEELLRLRDRLTGTELDDRLDPEFAARNRERLLTLAAAERAAVEGAPSGSAPTDPAGPTS